jgi:hypothetical protein
MSELQPIAEASYVARKPQGADFQPLDVRIYAPVRAADDSEYRGMWICRCETTGAAEFAQGFPGMTSMYALEYALVMLAGYFAHLCDEYEVRSVSGGGEPRKLPLAGMSFLAALLEGKAVGPPS